MSGAALLIGNAAYDPLPRLRTPISDVRTLGDRLGELGFATMAVENADLRRMNQGIAAFRAHIERMPSGGSVFVYFAGHGAQFAGENYLMPTDAETMNEGWRRGSVTLSALLEDLCWQRDQQKLIVLDACRTSGIASITRTGALGLSGVSTSNYQQVSETMILYAARPGQVALDGATAGSSPLCLALMSAFDGLQRPLVNLIPAVATLVEEFTGGQQDPWYTGNVKRLAGVPFWGRADLASGPVLRGELVAGDIVARSHQFRSAQDQAIAAKGHLVHKFKATDSNGHRAYYYLLVEKEREKAFLAAFNREGTMDVNDFGSVVASCYGDEPTPQIRKYLRERYGWEV